MTRCGDVLLPFSHQCTSQANALYQQRKDALEKQFVGTLLYMEEISEVPTMITTLADAGYGAHKQIGWKAQAKGAVKGTFGRSTRIAVLANVVYAYTGTVPYFMAYKQEHDMQINNCNSLWGGRR